MNTILQGYKNYLCGRYRKQRTIKNYYEEAKQFLKHLNKNPKNLTKQDIEQYRIHIYQKYSRNTITIKLCSLNHFLEYLEKPELRVKTPPLEITEQPTLTEEEYFSGNWEKKVKEYNEKQRERYNGKFKGEKINLGQSPGARKSLGISYSKQRVYNIDEKTEIKILEYLREKKKQNKISSKEIDKIFGYKDTAGHWFRLDRGGRSLPKPEDWKKLKEILRLDNRFDKIMTEQHYVLQTIKHHKNGKNPGDLWIIPQTEDFDERGDVWKISLEKVKDAHFAVFPTSLPYKIIKAFCPKDGIVLDPFAGSGTTGRAARMLNRKSILIDINPEYKKIIEKRCEIFKSKLSDFKN